MKEINKWVYSAIIIFIAVILVSTISSILAEIVWQIWAPEVYK